MGDPDTLEDRMPAKTNGVLMSRTWRGRHSLNVEHIAGVAGRVVRVRLDVEFGTGDGPSPAKGEIKLFVPDQGEWKSIYRVPTPDLLASSKIQYADKGEFDHETGTYPGKNMVTTRGGDVMFALDTYGVGTDLTGDLPDEIGDLLKADTDSLVAFAEKLMGAVA